MKNVTLAVQDTLLEAARKYTAEHGTTLNALMRKLLTQTVGQPHDDWVERCFRELDRAKGHSGGKSWRREDLYDV